MARSCGFVFGAAGHRSSPNRNKKAEKNARKERLGVAFRERNVFSGFLFTYIHACMYTPFRPSCKTDFAVRLHPLILTGFLALLASGCAVGPDFERPDAPGMKEYDADALPDATSSAKTEGGEAQNFAMGEDIPAEWWTLFHSDTLNALVTQALENNPDIEAADAALREANENAAAVSGQLFPEVDASFSSTREKTTGAAFGGTFPGSIYTLHNASVSVSYGIDLFGGERRAIEEAEAQAEYQDFQLKAAWLSLTANVVTAAIQEASLKAQVAATEKIIADEDKQRSLLQDQLDAGAVAKTALLAQETTLAQVRATLPPLKKQLSSVRHQLAALLGETPDKAPPSFDLANLTLPQKLPLSLPAKLVEQRPDVLAAEANLHAASAAIGVAIANRLPGITLTGNIGSDANQLDKLFTPGGGVWSLGAGVAATIFDAGTLEHKQGAADAAFDVARAQYRKTVIGAFQNVADSLRALEEDANALKSETAAWRAADNSLALTRDQYSAGAVGFVALVTAEQAEQQTRVALVQAEAQRFADTAALFQALGGGWWNKPVKEAAND
jgi:NodT family efflux transporter outer membrane factor (OMF) lipoprotein